MAFVELSVVTCVRAIKTIIKYSIYRKGAICSIGLKHSNEVKRIVLLFLQNDYIQKKGNKNAMIGGDCLTISVR